MMREARHRLEAGRGWGLIQQEGSKRREGPGRKAGRISEETAPFCPAPSLRASRLPKNREFHQHGDLHYFINFP